MHKLALLRATSAAAVLALGSGLAVTPASAQQTAESRVTLEEIVVTARKVEENIMNVPIAITAFSSKDLDALGVKQMIDISTFTPSFHFVNQQGGSGRNDRTSNALVFRGLYLGNNLANSAGGLLFIDGAPVLSAQPPANPEIARVEVLKGPQSAYFGRSTFAGAINFVTTDPGDKFKGRVSAEYSSFNSDEENLSVEGPIVADKLSMRVSGRHFNRGGYYTNAAETSEKFGGQSTNSISSTMLLKPNDSFKVKAFFNYFEDNDGPPAQGAIKSDQFNCNLNPPPAGTPQAALSRSQVGYYCGALPTVDKIPAANISGDYTLTPYMQKVLFNPNPSWLVFDPSFNTHGGMVRHGLQADIKMEYEFADGFNATSLTAYHRDQYQSILDLNYRDGRSLPNNFLNIPTVRPDRNFTLVAQAKNRDWSQELRVTSPQAQAFRYTGGFSYINYLSPGGSVYGNTPAGPLFTAAITRTQTKTPAVFGGLYYDILPDLTATAEARYQWDSISQQVIIGTNQLPPTGAAALPLTATYRSFSPRVSLDYKYAQDSTVYGLWSRGTRPGGFNSGLATSTPAVVAALLAVAPTASVAYQEEKLDNFELGIKSTWLDGRARTTLAAYYDKWKNGQVTNSVPIIAAGVANLVSVVINNGAVDLKGVEFEGQYQVNAQFKVSGTIAYNGTDVKNYQCGDCNLVFGNFNLNPNSHHLPTAPDWTWTLSGEYADHLTSTYDWFGRADYVHTGKNYADFSNVAWVGASNKINLHLGVRNETLTIEGFVLNATNDKTLLAGLIGIDVFTFLAPAPQKNEIRYSLPIPRTFGIKASYNF